MWLDWFSILTDVKNVIASKKWSSCVYERGNTRNKTEWVFDFEKEKVEPKQTYHFEVH